METLAFSCDVTNGQVWSRDGLFRSIRYESGAATGGVPPVIRVRSVVGQAYDCEMVPGKTITIPEAARGIVIQNISGGAVLAGKITAGAGSITDNSVVGTVSLDAAALLALEQINVRPEGASGSYKATTAMAVNTAEQIFSPGANANGAILLNASWFLGNGAGPFYAAIVAKNGVPANITDGEVVANASSVMIVGTAVYECGDFQYPQMIPAGLGLYFISTGTTAAGYPRAARFKLL